MFLDTYKSFLFGRGKSLRTADMYSRKLRSFLERGFSEKDLIGAANQLIERYSRGGTDYDPKDHGNTVSALKQLNEFIPEDCLDTLYIKYVYPFSTFSAPVHRVEYTIENRHVIVQYSNGKVKNKRIPNADFYVLANLLKDNENDLSDAFCPPPLMIDYAPGHYDYSFRDKSGTGCPNLFDGNSNAENAFDSLIHKILP